MTSATGVVIGLIGVALIVGGGWLIGLGGSWYYLIAGLGFIATAALVFSRSPAALPLYALVVVGTLAWAVWETGCDWWPLAARGDIVFLVGIWLLMPWITRRLTCDLADRPPMAWRGSGLVLAGSLVIAAIVGVVSLLSDYHDVAGDLPGAQANAAPPAAPLAGGIDVPTDDWHAYGRSSLGDKYAPLTQINTDNVRDLKVAWTYRTGDIKGPDDPQETTYELTPIKIGDSLYICTPHNLAIALDADTGNERWRYDPKSKILANLQHLTCRGVSYHGQAPGAAAAPNGECPERIFLPTADARLIALDAKTGHPCPSFGQNGAVDLWQGMPDPKDHAGMYYSTSPPVVTRDLVIVAGAVTDNFSVDEPSGVIRAYDVNTGRLVWNFDPGNPDQTAPIGPDQAYTRNSPNSWIVSSADEQLGLIYLPMGNQTPDQWGGKRGPETERFASSILALEIATGKRALGLSDGAPRPLGHGRSVPA